MMSNFSNILLSTKTENNVFDSSYFQIILWKHVFQILKYYKKNTINLDEINYEFLFPFELVYFKNFSICNYLGNIEKTQFCFY